MTNKDKNPIKSNSIELLKKIKNLQCDKLYSVASFTKKDDSSRVILSRLADSGIIVKYSRGYFFKPTNKTLYKNSNKVIPLDKTLFANDLFWSVKDGFKIETKKLIQAYLSQYSEGDIMGLYSLFGYKRVLSDALKLYKKRTNKDYQKIRDILQRIEIWRFDDKRDR